MWKWYNFSRTYSSNESISGLNTLICRKVAKFFSQEHCAIVVRVHTHCFGFPVKWQMFYTSHILSWSASTCSASESRLVYVFGCFNCIGLAAVNVKQLSWIIFFEGKMFYVLTVAGLVLITSKLSKIWYKRKNCYFFFSNNS